MTRPSGLLPGALHAAASVVTHPTRTLLDLSVATSRLPVVGPVFKPLGSLTAITLFAARVAPEYISDMRAPHVDLRRPPAAEKPKPDKVRDRALSELALQRAVGDLEPTPEAAARAAERPVRCRNRRTARAVLRNEPYTDLPRGPRLDVWADESARAGERRPVLLFIPGGGWIFGMRQGQGGALLKHLSEAGWVCVTIDYRSAPHDRWPAHIIDAKRAVAWIRENIAEYGGDPESVAVAGGSAGGHIASLLGLTPNNPRFQPGFEDVDTTVRAVVGLYGRYDWESRDTLERKRLMGFIEHVVVGTALEDDPQLYRDSSPIHLAAADAPPFLVVHGDSDSIIPVEQGRDFAVRLAEVSDQVVRYAELPGAGHAYDVLDAERARATARAVEQFLAAVQTSATAVPLTVVGGASAV
ncbi:alpha/beta hydrolase [Nocardioides acrostichi]|uniref:Alpha/beta hydrolase n=1 Tax=Nocardioides acrostichi TaxID=2784339 RepID=A0A930V0J0_9ACTN|nr:alpha/beta hydrolase [Nocardioides acrostichi]MBF4163466.1 alpha/beta hydrolase [Nocardioides acrostichi]